MTNQRDPYIRQRNGFRVEAGTDSAKNGKIDYACTTDLGQGLIIYQNGNSDFIINGTSKERVGHHIEDNKSPAKLIDAVNGNIHLRAKNGTITLEAANIRIIGVDGFGGEVTIQGSKIVHMEAPTVGVQASGDATIAASKEALVSGAVAASLVTSGKNSCSSGTDADSSSLLSQLMSALTKFKEFFSSICSK